MSPEPDAPEAPECQGAEQEDVNQERVLALEATKVPKRTTCHSPDSRAERASDVVENNTGAIINHTPVNENAEQDSCTKRLSEKLDNRVSIFPVFLYKSISFFG